MLGIDTNVLVRFLVQDDEGQAKAARNLLSGLSLETPGFITQVTLVELWWVLRNTYRYDKKSCLAAVQALVAVSVLEFDDGEGVVRALQLTEQGADFPDALIQGAMELFGVTETATFDRGAATRLGWRLLDATQ